MKKVNRWGVAAVVLPLALGMTSGLAFGAKEGKPAGHGRCAVGFERGIMRQLDLSAGQKEQLKAQRQAHQQSIKDGLNNKGQARQGEMQAHRAKMQALVLADNFDQAAANELAQSMVAKQAEHKVKMLAKQHQMLSILTPEQKAKFAQLQNEHFAKCQAKRQ